MDLFKSCRVSPCKIFGKNLDGYYLPEVRSLNICLSALCVVLKNVFASCHFTHSQSLKTKLKIQNFLFMKNKLKLDIVFVCFKDMI